VVNAYATGIFARPVRDTSTSPSGSISVMRALSFLDSVISKTSFRSSNRRRGPGRCRQDAATLTFYYDLDQRHLALDEGCLVGQIVNYADWNEARQLCLDLLDDLVRVPEVTIGMRESPLRLAAVLLFGQ
jgi:hypothetical protein